MAQFRNMRLAAIVVMGTAVAGCEEFAALVETPEAQTTAAAPTAARSTQPASSRSVAPAPALQPAQFVPINDPFTDGDSGASNDSGGFGGGFDESAPVDDNTTWN
jgi:predicted pyridoxine 5'-phosphate oxidase superfamily flavin-nucleotide-binding protein